MKLRRLKDRVLAALPFPAELLLVVAGLGCYLGTCLVARKPLTWPWALLPGLCLSLALEGWEILDHHGASGMMESSIGEIARILARHLEDVAWMNVPPAVLLAAAATRLAG